MTDTGKAASEGEPPRASSKRAAPLAPPFEFGSEALRSRETAEGARGAMLCVEIERFELSTGGLDREVREALLSKIERRLQSACGNASRVAQLAAGQLAVFAPGVADHEAGAGVAARAIEFIGRPFLIDGNAINLSAHAGAALAEAAADLSDRGAELLRRARIALAHAKISPGGRLALFKPAMTEAMEEKRSLENDLRRALPLKQLRLYFQPQIDIRDSRLIGFEALIRWARPERGVVSPAAFLPLAEEAGLIQRIGAWVMAEACRQAARWPGPVTVAVNASPKQFADPGLLDQVDAALRDSGLPPERLEIEITEDALFADEAAAAELMSRLRARGVRLAIDDFGTGYASLNYLRRLPFDKIKIDQSFVRGSENDPTARAIVRAIAGLGASLNLPTLAEGVETPAQLDAVRADGCVAAQGYLFGRPTPGETVPDLIRCAARPAPELEKSP